ncbi:MAG: acyltransferase family protein, partial [Rubripirellula sp.]
MTAPDPNLCDSTSTVAASNDATTILKPHRRIVELDSLRALAAINLVLFHFTLVYTNKHGYSSPLGFQWPFGAYGVEMFFILSGFVNSM